MKQTTFFVLFMMVLGIFTTQAQYNTINVIREDYVTVSSKEGISVTSVTPNQDKSYTVVLKNNNTNAVGEIKSYCFDWYLSYKGKRVSDYFQETIRCGRTATRQVYCWPGEVPSGYERYVTVQLGKEPVKKDRRDDD
ncbi:MAG: hypothetical protein IJM65_08255 [Bacteroidales bacterium]|nr:hypothetical protein [Bacteroidales bacterium]